jgi:molybdenum cofactor guanylyltransferase
MSAPMRCAAAILAGGHGTRMGGRRKAFLSIEGRRIIDRQLDILVPLFTEIWISANDPEAFDELGFPIVTDPIPDVGPLGGLLGVLEAVTAPRVFVIAGDMPFIVSDAVRLVAFHPDEAPIVVPVVGGRPEPLFARYARVCIPAIRRSLAVGQRRTTGFHSELPVRVVHEEELRAVDPSLSSLANVNRPEDLR